MDNVLVDFPSGIACLCDDDKVKYDGNYDECPNIFSLMQPMPGAIESYKILSQHFETYILSTSPWINPSAWMHKLEWVHEHLGSVEGTSAYKRLILTHHKNLNKGDFLIDDRVKNGVKEFEGEHIHFGTPQFPDWNAVMDHIMQFV